MTLHPSLAEIIIIAVILTVIWVLPFVDKRPLFETCASFQRRDGTVIRATWTHHEPDRLAAVQNKAHELGAQSFQITDIRHQEIQP